jgi:tRNA-dihydrouridine synthase B
MRHPALALECVKIIRDEWPGPFTVKTRILDESDPAPTVELVRSLYHVGVEGVTIHGRLAERIYAGPVHGDIIRAVREALPVPVTANGGIFSLADAQALAASSGCGRVMVARGAIGNPWLFRELFDGTAVVPTSHEVLDCAEEHLALMVDEYGERAAMILGRKILSSYICGRGFPHALRACVVRISTWREAKELLAQLRLASPDASGTRQEA